MYEYRTMTPEEQKAIVEERKAKGFPLHSPPHPVNDHAYYFLTAACYEHKPHLEKPERRRELLEKLFEKFQECGHEIRAWVVLQNHYHLLAKVDDFKTLSDIFGKTHGGLSFKWNGEDNQKGRTVWYKFSDRAIRSERHYYTTLNYIHYNPVRHKHSVSPYDWEDSSVHWYLEHYGREWLRDLWKQYPLKSYGEGWDEGL